MGDQRLSESESYIMQFFWSRGALKTDELGALAAEKNWKQTTLLTFLSRLAAKGVLAVERVGKQNIYRPLVSRAEYLAAEGRAFLQDVYGGSARDFIAAMVDARGITAAELDDLRRFIDEQEGSHA